MRRRLMLVAAATFTTVASAAAATAAVAGVADGPIATNLPPQAALTSPVDGSVGILGCPLTFAAVASDPDNEIRQGRPDRPDDAILVEDGIDRVEFYLNGELLAVDGAAPYEVTVDRGPFVPQVDGTNTAFVRAYDNDDPQLTTESQAVSFLMVDPPPGLPGDQCLEATPPPPTQLS